MKRTGRISLAFGLMLCGIVALGWTWSWAQGKAKQAEPLALIPAGTVLLASSDGDAAHQAAWEKTAAYEAFRKSGLLDTLTKMVREVLEQLPDERAHAAVEIFEFVNQNGLTISIGFAPGNGPGIPYLTVVAHNAGPHGGALDQFVEALGPDAELKIEKRNPGGTVSRVVLPGTPNVELGWWAQGEHLVLVLGVGAVDAAIAVAEGKSPNFAATPQGKKLAAKPTFDRTGLFWLDFAALRGRFGDIPLPSPQQPTITDVLKTLGLDKLNSVLAQSGYKGRSLWSTVDVDAPGSRKGLLGLADPATTMSLSDLPPLPVSHVGFFAQSLSLADAYDKLLEVARNVANLGPPEATEQLDTLLEQMPELLGCDLRKDILAPLGTVQCMYSDSNQGLFGADYGLIVQMKDAAKLRATVKKLLERLADQVPAELVSGVERDKHGQKLITLQVGGGSFNPTILIDDKWLCVGASSQTVEAFALRLKGELPVWKPDAETAEVLTAVPKKFSSISIAYPRPMIRGLVAAAPLLMGFAEAGVTYASRFGVIPPIELKTGAIDLPPAELVVRPLFPNVSWCVVDEAGIHLTTRSSAPAIPLVGGADGSSVAVVAVLVALLLPAVQQAREAARRTQSKNNLKQIGLAMHNFHDTFDNFPQGTIPSKKLKPEQRQSWLVPLLPFMDQAPLYNQMKVDLRESAEWDSDDLQSSIKVVIPSFLNPSNAIGFVFGEPATTDYVGWAGVGKDAPTEKAKADKKGIFGYDRVTRIQDITDGTSNTVMVSDAVAKTRGPWAQGGPSTIRALTTKPYINGDDGIGSPHTGGLHVLFADGSVRFISENIDAKTLEALATRAGGEVVNDF